MRRNGFTLIELIVILVLLGILSVYVSMKNTDFTAHSGAEELVQALEHAREIAMSRTGSAVAPGVRIDNDGFSFTGIAAPPVEWQLLKPGPALSVNITPTGTVSFNGRGLPSCAGGLNCATVQQTITVSANGESVTLAIEPYTGLVHR
ncbi:MAG: GspH/FimT family pseudopilin [Pseudomonadota bacterium]